MGNSSSWENLSKNITIVQGCWAYQFLPGLDFVQASPYSSRNDGSLLLVSTVGTAMHGDRSWFRRCNDAHDGHGVYTGWDAPIAWTNLVRNATPEEWRLGPKQESSPGRGVASTHSEQRAGGPYDFARQPRLSFCKGDQVGAFVPSAGGGMCTNSPRRRPRTGCMSNARRWKQIEEAEKLPPDKDAEHQQLLARR